MKATLLAMATTLSGIIVFMKNVEKTRRAATHAAMMINTWALAFPSSAADAPPSSQGAASPPRGLTRLDNQDRRLIRLVVPHLDHAKRPGDQRNRAVRFRRA